MNLDQFEGRLCLLSSLLGSDQTTELFEQEYEALLNKVKTMAGPRFENLVRMKTLLMHQVAFLMTELLREEIKIRKCEVRGVQ